MEAADPWTFQGSLALIDMNLKNKGGNGLLASAAGGSPRLRTQPLLSGTGVSEIIQEK